MISDFIVASLGKAKYELLEDGSFYANVPHLEGVWANGKTLEACREELREVLEDWLLLKLKDGDEVPGLTDDHPVEKAGDREYA